MQSTRLALAVFLGTFGVLGYTVSPLRANPGETAPAYHCPSDSYECFEDYDCYGDFNYDYEGYGDRAVGPAALADDSPVVAPPVEDVDAPVVADDPTDEVIDDGYPNDGSDPCEYEYGCPYEGWYGDGYDYVGDDAEADAEADAADAGDDASDDDPADRLQRDLIDLLEDTRHSAGQEEVLEINEQNDGLVEAADAAGSEDVAVEEEAWRYDDCGYCGWALDEPVVAPPAEDDGEATAAAAESGADEVEADDGAAEYGDETEYDAYGSEYESDGYEYDDGGYGYDEEGYEYDDGGYGYDEEGDEADEADEEGVEADEEGERDEYGYDCDDYECEDYDEVYGDEYDTDDQWQDEAADTDQTAADGLMHGAIENAMRVMNQLGGAVAQISQQVGGIGLGTPESVSELPQIDTREAAEVDKTVEEDSLYWYSPDGDVGH